MGEIFAKLISFVTFITFSCEIEKWIFKFYTYTVWINHIFMFSIWLANKAHREELESILQIFEVGKMDSVITTLIDILAGFSGV